MRRNDKLVEISRRDFCAMAGCIGLIATGCTDGKARPVSTGALGDTPDAPQGDAADEPIDAAEQADAATIDASSGHVDASSGHVDASSGHVDAAGSADASSGHVDAAGSADASSGHVDASPPDAAPPPDAGGPTCSGTATDVGAASSFASGSPKMFSSGRFFVVRDSGGLYAVSSICTHQGATNQVQGNLFYCPRHGAEFSFNGDVIQGPAFQPLAHYAMCFMSNGNVGVIPSQTVAASTRLNA